MKLINNLISRFSDLVKKFTGSGNTNSIFKNMGILASGSLVAKLIGFGTYPFITRIYSPEDFGVLAVFTSAIAIMLPFATLRYSVIIPLPKNDGLAFNIFVMGIGLILIFTTLASGLFLIVGEPIFGYFNVSEIAGYWWLLVLGVFGGGFYELLSQWATRMKNFRPVAKTAIWQTTIAAVTKIGLGLIGLKPIGLLIGAVAQKGGGVFSLTRYFYKDIKLGIKEISIKKICFLLKYYKDLPFYRLPSKLLLTFSGQIPVLFFAFQFGAEPTGQLGLSLAVIGIPMGLIGTNIAKAYYAEIAKVGFKNNNKIFEITKSVVKRLSILSVSPTFLLILFAPLLFQIVFGGEWEQAGDFTRILAIYLLFQFITSPLVDIFTVYNMQRKFLEINIVRSVLMGFIFGVSYFLDLNVYQTLITYTATISGHYVFIIYQIYRVIRSESQ